jgi:ribose 5-phosphate isomerase A
MHQDEMKQNAAIAALKYVEKNSIIGIGTGTTTNFFIEALTTIKSSIEATVASSLATEKKLKSLGFKVDDMNTVDNISSYFDGADEFNNYHYLNKGGGGALTREKILATAAKIFICMADQSKKVDLLGTKFPVPMEVIPMARSFVARQLVKLGGDPVYREKFITDNGNIILDVHNLKIIDPIKMEQALNNIPGIVGNGIFAQRRADIILFSTNSDVKVLTLSK